MDNTIQRNSGKKDPGELLEAVTGNDIGAAIKAAGCSDTPGIVLEIAAIHKDKRVRLAAIDNKNLSDHTLLALCSDPDSDVRTAANALAEVRGL